MRSAEPSGVQAVVAANAADLLAYFERRVRPTADAADLVSEVLLVVWRRRTELPLDDLEARMWLFGVARRALANHSRTARRQDRLAARLREELAAAVRADEAASSSADEVAAGVRAAIAALPDDLAELVRLVHWDGFSLTEAATIMNVNPSTARSRYRRARALLAAELAGSDAPVVVAVGTTSH